jgi:hypothetical protein
MQETVEIAIFDLCAQWFFLGLFVGVLLTLLGKAFSNRIRDDIKELSGGKQ